jgi:hypothetical protein
VGPGSRGRLPCSCPAPKSRTPAPTARSRFDLPGALGQDRRESFPSILLERDTDCDPDAGVHAVIYVVPIVGVINIYVVGFVPRRRPRFRPRIDKRNPIAVVLEARIPAHEDRRKAVDAEEVVTPEVEPEAIIRNSVAVVAATLTPTAVVVIPRSGPRLAETAAHLPLVLWDAARVDTAIGGPAGLDAAMIDAPVALLRSWRRFTGLLLTLWLWLCGLLLLALWLWLRGFLLLTLWLWLCGFLLLTLWLWLRGFLLLTLWLCGFLLLMLLPLLGSALLLFLLLALCVDRSNRCEEKTQSPYADSQFHRHTSLLLKIDRRSAFLRSEALETLRSTLKV